MGTFIDLTNQKFGRWTMLSRDPRKPANWLARCACGTERSVNGKSVRRGDSVSCGCFRAENIHDGFKHGLTTHGERHPLYEVWSSMRARCNNPNNKRYSRYGGRGVAVCPRWDDFAAFVADMGERPEGCSLDRINNHGDYTPENCRWADRNVQANNTRMNVLVTWQGRRLTIAEWSRETGVPYRVLWERITLYKWPLERAFSEPVRRW